MLDCIVEQKADLFDENFQVNTGLHELPVQVNLPNIQLATFNLLLDYIYSGCIPSDPEQSVYLRNYATNFGLFRCRDAVTFLIKKNLTCANVLSVLKAADLSGTEDVKTYAFSFIADNYEDIVFTEELKSLKQELLVQLLQVPTKSFKTKSRAMNRLFEESEEVVAPSELKNALLSLVGNPKFADVSFVVEGQVVPAHQCVLFSRHPTFTRLWFETGMKESSTKQVNIEKVTKDVWMQLLRYMYSGVVQPLTLSEALDLIWVADQYLLDSLKSHCEDFVTTCLKSDNVLEVLQVANACRLTQLKDLCLDLLSNNFRMLSRSEEQLANLDRENLIQIITAHARSCSHSFSDSQ